MLKAPRCLARLRADFGSGSVVTGALPGLGRGRGLTYGRTAVVRAVVLAGTGRHLG